MNEQIAHRNMQRLRLEAMLLARDVELVLHEGYHVRHVPGDPRCEQCRAGRRLVEA